MVPHQSRVVDAILLRDDVAMLNHDFDEAERTTYAGTFFDRQGTARH